MKKFTIIILLFAIILIGCSTVPEKVSEPAKVINPSTIDFVFQLGGEVVPVEVKAAENPQSKSLKSYDNKYRPKYAVRSSLSDYRKEDWLIKIPLYAINHIIEILESD